jgi:hypothetical protein
MSKTIEQHLLDLCLVSVVYTRLRLDRNTYENSSILSETKLILLPTNPVRQFHF